MKVKMLTESGGYPVNKSLKGLVMGAERYPYGGFEVRGSDLAKVDPVCFSLEDSYHFFDSEVEVLEE